MEPDDDNSFNLGDRNLYTTKEILKAKSAVCDGYSALFIAIARNLGIPARVVFGWYLNEKGLDGHAWVEVKINTQQWWPLEPQRDDWSLPSMAYFPVGIFLVYERQDSESELQFLLNLATLQQAFNQSTWTRTAVVPAASAK